jgi:outer membrane protein OmpA-like peptidoglycan-associated protein
MRAQYLADFVLAQGVRPNLVAARGYGEADPVGTPGRNA